MKKIFILLTIVTLSLGSCKRVNFGDINRDPSVPTTADIDGLMRGAMVSFSTGAGRVYYSNATLYAQYQSQTIYTQEQRYVQYNGSFYSYFVRQLKPLNKIINTTEDTKLRGNTDNMRAIAQIMSTIIWKRITDTYGDIPYTNSLDENNLTPDYTSQKDVYLDLIAKTKAARDLLNSGAFTPDADTDIFYGGDINKWGKLANSLILSLSLQLHNTSEENTAKSAFNEALSDSYGVLENVDENMVFETDPRGGISNPISASRPGDFRLTKELTDAMKGKGPWGNGINDTKNVTSNHTLDKRILAIAARASRNGLPYGYGGYPRAKRRAATGMRSSFNRETAPFTIFSSAYTWLNRAHASAINWTTEDFNTMLTNGISKSYEQFFAQSFPSNITAALNYATSTYIPARIADVATTSKEQVVGEEKWFALFPDGFAAWAEQRKTGWPALHAAPEAVNGSIIPHRMLYPNNERDVNPNGWNRGVQGLRPTEDLNTSKIWWER